MPELGAAFRLTLRIKASRASTDLPKTLEKHAGRTSVSVFLFPRPLSVRENGVKLHASLQKASS